MKKKAKTSFREARLLAGAREYNGAANRLYYALYQAMMAEFEAKGFDPGRFARPDPRHPEKWPHHVIRNNCSLIGVNPEEREVLKMAWRLRVKSDYQPDSVERKELEPVLQRVPDILEALGV